MELLTPGETFALCSLALAFATFAIGRIGSTRAGAADKQRMSDQLDRIAEMCRETRNDVREINRKLSDHSQTLTRHAEQIAALDGRVNRLEEKEN